MNANEIDCLPQDTPWLEPLRRALAGTDGDLIAAYVFGSAARDQTRAGSDLDLAVLCATDPPPGLAGLHLDLADDLREVVGRPVDLVVLNRAPVDLVHRVLRDGLLVLDRDRAARIRFEIRARSEYLDLLPHLRRYRRLDIADGRSNTRETRP